MGTVGSDRICRAMVAAASAFALAAGSPPAPSAPDRQARYQAYIDAGVARSAAGEDPILVLSARDRSLPDLEIRPRELIVTIPAGARLADPARAIAGCAGEVRVVRSVPGFPIHLVEVPEANPLARAITLETCLASTVPGATVEPNQVMRFFQNQQAVLTDLLGQEQMRLWQYLNLGHNGGVVDADGDGMEALSRYLHAEDGPRPRIAPVVAVADTGVMTIHPALRPALWVNSDEVAGNGRDDDQNGVIDDINGWNFAQNNHDLTDYSGHGTHVAGIIGARMPQFPWHVGIAPNSRLMVIKLALRTDRSRLELFDALTSTAYAADNGAHVINMSYGNTLHSPAQDASMVAAHAKGVILVAAAGNSGKDLAAEPVWPCLSPYVFCVANSSRNDTLWPDSNYSDTYFLLAAPGAEIWSTSRSDPSGYELRSGTSMAAPLVAGTMAALRSLYPDWTVEQIYGRVIATADRPGTLRPSGTNQRLNIYRALYGSPRLGRPADGYCDEHIPTPQGQTMPRWQNFPFANSGEPGIDGWSTSRAFTICTQAQLLAMDADVLDRFFILRRDIDWSADASGWNQIGAEVTTGGTINRPFNGILDGNDHVIRGFRSAGRPWAGLIAELGPRGLVTNLRMSDVDIRSHGQGGSIATISSGTIVDVQVEGRLTAERSVGGIAGEVRGGRIVSSFFEGTLSSQGQAGGLASQIRLGSEVLDSWFQGRITGSVVGGVTAWMEQSRIRRSHAYLVADGAETIGGLAAYQICKSTIQDSYADGRLAASREVGGLVALQSDSQVYHSFAAPFLLSGQKRGGLVAERRDGIGTNYEGGSPARYCDRSTQLPPPSRNVESFYDSVRISQAGVDAIPKTTAALQRADTFASWPHGYWHYHRGFYPQLRNLPRTQQASR